MSTDTLERTETCQHVYRRVHVPWIDSTPDDTRPWCVKCLTREGEKA